MVVHVIMSVLNKQTYNQVGLSSHYSYEGSRLEQIQYVCAKQRAKFVMDKQTDRLTDTDYITAAREHSI